MIKISWPHDRLIFIMEIPYHLETPYLFWDLSEPVAKLSDNRNTAITLQWRHNERDGILNHQPPDYLLNRLFKAQIKETSKLRVPGLYEGNSPVTGPVTRKMFPFDDVIMKGKLCVQWLKVVTGSTFRRNIHRYDVQFTCELYCHIRYLQVLYSKQKYIY